MKMILSGLVISGLVFISPAHSQPGKIKLVRLTDFCLQSGVLIKESGDKISDADCRSSVYWFPVKVPCTVLTGLVANGVYPDPYQGLNNMYIPDASDESNAK